MSLTTEDKQYIGTAITDNNKVLMSQVDQKLEKLFGRFQEESSRYMGALKEGFEHKVDMLAELIRERPTRSEVVDMIQEHTRPIVRQETYKVMQSEFAPVLSEIRLVMRSHEKRIAKLETVAQH